MQKINSIINRLFTLLSAVAVSVIWNTASASVIYEYFGTINVVFEDQGGTIVQVPALENTDVSGFVEIADEDFVANASLTLSDLISWEFSWVVNNNNFNIDISFDHTDYIGAGAFSLDGSRDVLDWLWDGQNSADELLCAGCFGFANTRHTFENAQYDVRGIDGSWTLAAVPVPAALPLLASGLMSLAFIGRRRTK